MKKRTSACTHRIGYSYRHSSLPMYRLSVYRPKVISVQLYFELKLELKQFLCTKTTLGYWLLAGIGDGQERWTVGVCMYISATANQKGREIQKHKVVLAHARNTRNASTYDAFSSSSTVPQLCAPPPSRFSNGFTELHINVTTNHIYMWP